MAASPIAEAAVAWPATSPAPDVMKHGDAVMITGGDMLKMLTLKAGLRMKLGKVTNVDVSSLIGQPCGILYEVDEANRCLVPYDGPTLQDSEEADTAVDDAGKDNRHLLDTSAAQAMTQEEIEALKASGMKNIVDKLVQASATFGAKTAFSQQKYIRRKKKKYLATFAVERPHPDSMCELWCPTRRNEAFPAIDVRWIRLRVDSVAQLIALANIHASSRVMISERTNGFVPAAVMDRLGTDGQLYQVLNPQKMPTMTNAKEMQIPDVKRRWKCLRRDVLLNPNQGRQHPAERQARVPKPERSEEENASAMAAAATGADSTMAMVQGPAPAPEPSQWYNGFEARAHFTSDPCDALIVADDSLTLPADVAELLPFVAYGATIAVYCPYLEPLCELFRLVRDDCVCMTIRDTWYREYQVLPGRCHPFVNMTHNGGYLFSAIRVERRIPNPAFPRSIPAPVLAEGFPAVPPPAAVDVEGAAEAAPEANLKRHRAENETA